MYNHYPSLLVRSSFLGMAVVRKHVSIALLILVCFGITSLRGGEAQPRVMNGIDVLREQEFKPLAGKRIALLTNHTGLAADGTSSIDLLYGSKLCKLVFLFSPEHGIQGALDGRVNSSTDEKTGLPVYSLYIGDARRPSIELLKDIDAMVFDVQDIGARFYTYVTTMGYCMEGAAKANIPFYVLDRPNPIGGVHVEGPMLDPDKTSFTGYMPLPVRHGMTVGELARYFNAEKKLGVDLHVIPMKGWSRSCYFWDTGQLWVNPSPNMRTMMAAILYPGVCLLESTNVSVGRGTDTPFEILGAPWIEPRRFAAELAKAKLPGIRAVPVFFTPSADIYRGKKCGGVSLTVTDPDKLNSVLLGLSLVSIMHRLYRDEFKIDKVIDLLGNSEALRMLRDGKPPAEVLQAGGAGMREFLAKRQKALIYDVTPRPKKERQ
jgi:uncharacterized protein YbbC (DUF1343 family)